MSDRFILYLDLRVWHGEENVANWRVFDGIYSADHSAKSIFDNDKTTKYISKTHTSNQRKIEITFHEPIYFDKLVILRPDDHDTLGFKN